jgi:hypothetical protein
MADRQLRESPAGKARLHRAERCTLTEPTGNGFASMPHARQCRAVWSGRHGTNTKEKPGTMPGFLLALYADQTDAYIRGEHYHAGYQQSIVTVSGHSLRS